MWTNTEIEYLKENYSNVDNRELSLILNKKRPTIIRMANSLNLKKNKEVIIALLKINNPGVQWSTKEEDFLKNNFNNKSYEEMSKDLNKTKKSIIKKIKKMGLIKTKDNIKKIISKNNKERGRDLNYELVKNIALKYNSRQELYIKDPSVYNFIIKNGWSDELCKHMITKNFSVPQLLMKDILEHILKEKCSYNDRKIIKPLEIDCYFEKWKIGWEYDGIRFHKEDNIKKINECISKGILLFVVDEKSKLRRKYEENIKNQLTSKITAINTRTGLNINERNILEYKPKIVYPNLLTKQETDIIKNKLMSEIKRLDVILYKKIKKYELFNDVSLKIIDDQKIYKKINSFEEFIEYIKINNIKKYSELCEKEHPHRIMKRLGLPLQKIKDYFIN